MSSSTRTWSAGASLAVVGVLLALYATSGPRTLPEADSGELAAVAVCGGIAHPPGYPLLTLALQLFARLAPVFGVIPALSMFSLLCAAAAAWISMRVLFEEGYALPSAGLATLAVFQSEHVWRAATSFEPFALNLLLATCVLWSSARLIRGARGQERALSLSLGALFGLGLCNHHSLITLAPLALYALCHRANLLMTRATFFALGALLGATPLLAFLVLRTQTGFVWGDWQDFVPRLITHVLRREYGSFQLTADQSGGSWLFGPSRFVRALPSALSWPLLVPLALGIWVAATRARCERRLLYGVALSFLASGLLFPMLFRLRGTALDHMIADRFFALPSWLLLLVFAEGFEGLSQRVSKPVLASLLVLQTVMVWPEAERRTRRFYEDHVRNVFDVLPANAALIVAADGGFSGGLYGRCVLHRQDVQVVITGLAQPWYVERLAQDQRAGTQRPLYLLDIPGATHAAPPTFPVGPLLRVATAGVSVPGARALFEQNRTLFERLRLPEHDAIGDLDAWEAEELTNYWRCWDEVGKRLRAEGDLSLAKEAYRYRDLFKR